ncbi:MAG: hypothetical protein A2Z71_00270 [Chloroflexi bacterium RBG_13_50_21]|nr:MAG: hypothetical protein A2Z71_00270 [Chloroflexi bacterium RBG_13_50_21]
MKILYVADGRSQIALNWISYFIDSGNDVYLVSTFPCQQIDGLSWLTEIPVAMSGFYKHVDRGEGESGEFLRKIIPVKLRTLFRQYVAPLSFPRATSRLQELIESVQPDLIHAMRIPYEGMIAALAIKRISEKKGRFKKPPLLISVWGNDFTLHARSTSMMAEYTKQALLWVDGLHTDCQRDMRLAMKLGFDITKPRIVLPGGGGVQLDIFYPSANETTGSENNQRVGNASLTIINPRGYRAYVNNDTFFRAISIVLDRYPEVHFICPDMLGEDQADKWIAKLRIGNKVDLLPAQSHEQMAELFRRSQITVSITTHDGTPNTLLEAMACGCFPIVGDIDSLHEWITPGMNGLLVDPGDPNALADAIKYAINQPELRRQAREQNRIIVKERGEYGKSMHAAAELYGRLVANNSDSF